MGRTRMMRPVMLATGLLAGAVVIGGSGVGTASDRCALTQPKECGNTNSLVWSTGFQAGLARFLGIHAHDRVGYLGRHGSLDADVQEVLGGAPQERVDLANSGFLFTACRSHSCNEKGALAFDAHGRIVTVGIVSFYCGKSAVTCSSGPILDLFVRNLDASAEARTAIVAWATAATAKDAAILHQKPLKGPYLHVLTHAGATTDDR